MAMTCILIQAYLIYLSHCYFFCVGNFNIL